MNLNEALKAYPPIVVYLAGVMDAVLVVLAGYLISRLF